MSHTQEKSVAVLNSFLRGEISALETYRQALGKLDQSPSHLLLEECMHSHAERISVLTQQIRTLGGSPSINSGIWGAFAKAVEGSAKVFGEEAAIAALEQGEDHGRNDYRRDVSKLDTASWRVVQSRVIPEQERTHSAMSQLKHSLQ